MRRTNNARRGFGIRGQLMFFLCFICLFLLVLFWILSTQLLEPLYTRHIERQLTTQAENVVSQLDDALAEGTTLSSWSFGRLYVNTGFFDKLAMDLYSKGALSSFCVDISDSTLRQIYKIENQSYCNLHETYLSDASSNEVVNTAIAMRKKCRTSPGGFKQTLNPPRLSGSAQLLVGRTTADGSYTVLVTTSLVHVAEASNVLSTLLPLAAALIFVFAMSAAWLFSEWFTKPLRQLSRAARQMAKGNYAVQVESLRSDELGDLAQDFNHMAEEVQRAAQMQRDLLANVSHDLRTPLTLIKGYAETVRDLTGDDKAHRDEQMNIIVDETDRLTALVSSVMELSKVTSGADRCERVNFDMGQLCDEVSERTLRRHLRPERLAAQTGAAGRGAARLRRPGHDAARAAQPAGQRHAPHRAGRHLYPAGFPLHRGGARGGGGPRPRHRRRRPALYLRPLLPLPFGRRQAGHRAGPFHHQGHLPAARLPLRRAEYAGQRHDLLVHCNGYKVKRPSPSLFRNDGEGRSF